LYWIAGSKLLGGGEMKGLRTVNRHASKQNRFPNQAEIIRMT